MDNNIFNRSNTTAEYTWFHDTMDIKPGYSAILNGNYIAFYTIHLTAITLIIASVLSCLIVIASILVRGSSEKLDFSDRFPLYLSISDFLWGLSHLTDHLVLVVRKVYPDTVGATFLSINLWFFLGYQEIMHAALATYIYLKVVRRKSINLGRWEWKLHAICTGIMALSIAVFYPLGSFGSTGYWFLHNVTTTPGKAMGFYIAISSSVQALCTTCGYSAIKKEISKQNKVVMNHQNKLLSIGQRRPKRHSIATQCLATFVRISVALYCTLALAYWAFSIQICLGVVEPFTVLIIVIVANSSGWANAIGYFYNNKIKARRAANKSADSAPTQSNVSVSSIPK